MTFRHSYKFQLVMAVMLIGMTILFLMGIRKVRADQGICEAAGRKLGDAELREVFVRSLVKSAIDISNHEYGSFRKGQVLVGLSRSASLENLGDVIDLSRGNGVSFEDNFGIANLNSMGDLNRLGSLDEYSLLTYGAGKNGGARLTELRSVERISNFEVRRDSIGFMDRYRGYGNYYFKIGIVDFTRDCCDNRKYSGEDISAIEERVRKAYSTSKEVIGAESRKRSYVASASNCGEILTRRDDYGFHRIKWINRRYVK